MISYVHALLIMQQTDLNITSIKDISWPLISFEFLTLLNLLFNYMEIVIIVTTVHGIRWEGGESRVTVHFFLIILFIVHCGFLEGVSKSTFSKYFSAREGGGHKKRTLCVRS